MNFFIEIEHEVVQSHNLGFVCDPTHGDQLLEKRVGLLDRLKNKLFYRGTPLPSLSGHNNRVMVKIKPR